ncbi:Hypothetical_protein [Hexamita inflata]|uniref:Hypothetical_protein n=1 Tax=Hexamita inflata TaxID=28002 RepID=A0AA86PNX8_9EUKA|nr:Hypothetical protein HINF_LOCUS26077 [Hexamita inflata]
MFSAQIGFNRNILESTGSTKDYYAPWKYTFSKLGSFDEQYNPKYYLLFSACLWSHHQQLCLLIVMSFLYLQKKSTNKPIWCFCKLIFLYNWLDRYNFRWLFLRELKIDKRNSNIIYYCSYYRYILVSSAGAIGFALALLNNGVLMFIDNNQIKCIKNSGKKQFKCSNKIIIAANIMILGVQQNCIRV